MEIKSFGLTHNSTFININPTKFNLNNSYDAAKFYESMFDMKNKKIIIENFKNTLLSKCKTIFRVLFR